MCRGPIATRQADAAAAPSMLASDSASKLEKQEDEREMVKAIKDTLQDQPSIEKEERFPIHHVDGGIHHGPAQETGGMRKHLMSPELLRLGETSKKQRKSLDQPGL